MINYSVYMMGNPIKPEMPEKAYAKAQVNEVIEFSQFVKHIADHNGVFSRGTVKGVVSDTCECLVEQLLNGNKIKFGELGIFSLSLKSEGAENIKKFTSDNITDVNILFTPGEDFENQRSRATVTPVSSRAAQQATYKAERAGETTVDLEAAKKKPSSGGGSDSESPEEI